MYVAGVLNLNGAGGTPKLNYEGEAVEMLIRKNSFDVDNEKREHPMKGEDGRTWKDKAIVFYVKYMPSTQKPEQLIADLYDTIKNYLLNRKIQKLLTEAMRSGMTKTGLVSKLEKKDADYWKMLKSVEPDIRELQSLDEHLCDEGIKDIMLKMFYKEFNKTYFKLGEDLIERFYGEGEFPEEIADLFQSS